jgi:hypothetical protein
LLMLSNLIEIVLLISPHLQQHHNTHQSAQHSKHHRSRDSHPQRQGSMQEASCGCFCPAMQAQCGSCRNVSSAF